MATHDPKLDKLVDFVVSCVEAIHQRDHQALAAQLRYIWPRLDFGESDRVWINCRALENTLVIVAAYWWGYVPAESKAQDEAANIVFAYEQWGLISPQVWDPAEVKVALINAGRPPGTHIDTGHYGWIRWVLAHVLVIAELTPTKCPGCEDEIQAWWIGDVAGEAADMADRQMADDNIREMLNRPYPDTRDDPGIGF